MRLAPDVPLALLTTLRLGGPARELAVLEDPADFPELAVIARRGGAVPRVIGYGSNVLAADDGYPGLVVRMATTGVRLDRSHDRERVLVTVQAGHELEALVDEMTAEGLSGIECLTGIPGTVGATPVQNVGAYGQEVTDTLASVRAWDWAAGQETVMTPSQCGLGHRTSVFKHSPRWTILTVTLELTPSKLGPPLTYRAVAEAAGVPRGERVIMDETVAAVREVRTRKGMILDPRDHDGRTAGSVSLSPVIPPEAASRLRAEGAPVNDFPDGATRVSASWLMKAAGFSLGQQLAPGARISRKHFTLVADDGATATSLAAAASAVAERVRQATGITLTAEPDLLGDLPAYARLSTHGDRESRRPHPARRTEFPGAGESL
jgi:UDP-N-acetylmuramate dehydrogenase